MKMEYPGISTNHFNIQKNPVENNTLFESFSWLVPDMEILPTGKNRIKIKGKALPHETISRNNKKYVDEELKMAARTWIDAPITINHSKWSEQKNHKGKLSWMEYDPTDGSMEYIGEVWNPEMVTELRLYKENPKASKITGVSIEAEFLRLACSKCKKKFTTEESWRKHMNEEEFIKDLPMEPHGIRGRALSLVVLPEVAGVVGSTLEVMETGNGYHRLIETFLAEKGLTENVGVSGNRVYSETPRTPEENKPTATQAPTKEETEPSPTVNLTTKQDHTFLNTHPDPKVKFTYNRILTVMDNNALEMQQRVKDAQDKSKITETFNENKQLKETVESQTAELEKKTRDLRELLTITENIKTEVDRLRPLESENKTLKETITQQTERNKTLETKVERLEPLAEANRKLIIENENLKDKLKPEFKGHAKRMVETAQNPDFNYKPGA